MLEIPDMSEKESLFNFMDGLQTWAQQELHVESLKLLNALNVAANCPKPQTKGLMYVEAIVNGNTYMVDTGATHNFVSVEEEKPRHQSYQGSWVA